MLVLIGWRGEPGIHDEPQHIKQGRVLTQLLDSLEIPWLHLNLNDNLKDVIEKCLKTIMLSSKPIALLISKGTFENYNCNEKAKAIIFSREQAIEIVSDHYSKDTFIVCTTGMASRELYEHRKKIIDSDRRHFLTVGSMGHASSISLGIAQAKPASRIVCIDGDGACLMHMGTLATIGQSDAKNLIHILINNGAHDSVGGQPTVGLEIDFVKISKACGYKVAKKAKTKSALKKILRNSIKKQGPIFIEVQVQKGHRTGLGRPEESPREHKKLFMDSLNAKF
jgi:phosphonopyruvate decarboxylase